MKRNFFPQPKHTKPKLVAKSYTPAERSSPPNPLPTVEQKIWIKADSQNIMWIWFVPPPGPSFAMSQYHAHQQGEVFVCLFCQHNTHDEDTMTYHFMAHVEKHGDLMLRMSSDLKMVRELHASRKDTSVPMAQFFEEKMAFLREWIKVPGALELSQKINKLVKKLPQNQADDLQARFIQRMKQAALDYFKK